MILRTKSMQTGGSMSGNTEYVPVDLAWQDVGKDMRSIQSAQLPKPDLKAYDKYNNLKLGGLESDRSVIYGQIESLKSKIKGGVGKDYSQQQYDADVKQLRFLVTQGVASLIQKEKRFKEVTTAATPARGDLAIQSGQAFVKDKSTGRYEVISVTDMLSEQYEVDGKKVLKYEPQTVGTGLEQRSSNSYFNGFQSGQGEALEGIMRSIRSTKSIDQQIKAAFSGLGHTVDTKTGERLVNGVTGSSLMDFISSKIYGKETNDGSGEKAKFTERRRTNSPNLDAAYRALEGSMDSSGLREGLERKAYGQYMAQFGSDPNAEDPEAWVERFVTENMNAEMLKYLRNEGLTSNRSAGSSSSSSGGDNKDLQYNPNSTSFNMSEGDYSISASSEDGIGYKVDAKGTVYHDPSMFAQEGYKYSDSKGLPQTIINNDIIRAFARGSDITTNLTSATDDNIQIDAISSSGSGGLQRAVLHPGTTPVILSNVLSFRSGNKSGIAWKILKTQWYATFKKSFEKEQQAMGNPITGPTFNSKLAKGLELYVKAMHQAGDSRFDEIQGYDFSISKVMQYTLDMPINTDYWLGGDRASAESFRELASPDLLIKDKQAIARYNMAVGAVKLDGTDGNGVPLSRGEELYKVVGYSIMNTPETIAVYMDTKYSNNKVSSGYAMDQVQGHNKNK